MKILMMTKPKQHHFFFCMLCALLLAWTATARAMTSSQEEDEDEHFTPLSQEANLELEMRKAFERIELKLREIDILLTDAGAGDTRRLREANEAGIDELLRNSVKEGREVQRAMDDLLNLAAQSSSSSSGGSSSQSQSESQGQSEGESQGQSSPTNQSQGEQGNQESTPSLPDQMQPGEEGGEKPGGKPEGEQPGEDGQSKDEGDKPGEGEQPKEGGEGKDDNPENIANSDPNADETAPAGGRPDLSKRWGELPVRVRDVFRTEGGDDMPAEYRDWIDAYYKKLNERADRGR